jgi:glycerophosphoryl diester phosphodiesterase
MLNETRLPTILLPCLTAFLLQQCAPETNKNMMDHFPAFYREGHRGTRGFMPENTIPSMTKAIEDGANIVELDIQISRDKKVLVAHDPYINRQFSLLPDGEEIPEHDSRRYVFYQMPYDSIRLFDVGSKYHSDFPQQKKLRTYIPLLGELIDSVEQYTSGRRISPVIYNIEIKSNPEKDGVYQPQPAELIDLVMEVVNSKAIDHRFYIQSFDVRQIQEVHNRYPDVVTGFLTSNKQSSLEDNLKSIGFTPDIYSPQYKLATRELVAKCHEQGMVFVPWTVNTLEEMKSLKELGVDGMITDYPNLFSELK